MYYLAYTEPGLQWVVSHIPKRIGRTQLEIVGARGTLAGGFTLERFESDHERVHHALRRRRRPRDAAAAACGKRFTQKTSRMRSAFVQVRRWKNPPPKSLAALPAARAHHPRRIKVHVDSGTFIAHERPPLRSHGREHVRRRAPSHASASTKPASIQDAMHVSGTATLRAADPMAARCGCAHSHSIPRTSRCGSSRRRAAAIWMSSASRRNSRRPSRPLHRQGGRSRQRVALVRERQGAEPRSAAPGAAAARWAASAVSWR